LTTKHSLTALLALGLAGAASVASTLPSLARSSYDGSWRVFVSADRGRCSDRFTVGIQVANGRVTYVGVMGQQPAGRVGDDGTIRLKISDVLASGSLDDRTGNGRWRSTTCNGSWVARKA
jgi:hypothetical protein